MYYVPFIFLTTVFAPIMFPSFFWKTPPKDDKIKTLYYHIIKPSENPFLTEQVGVSVYDDDEQMFFHIDNIHDNDSYEDLCSLLRHMDKNYKTIYMISYDTENKELNFKLVLEDLLDQIGTKIKFLNLKHLFYVTHPNISKITYTEILDYYRITKLDSKSIEYCIIHKNVMDDYQVLIESYGDKMKSLYEEITPFSMFH